MNFAELLLVSPQIVNEEFFHQWVTVALEGFFLHEASFAVVLSAREQWQQD